jgi:MFS transporter, DHA1 family, multidrug resistance protein
MKADVVARPLVSPRFLIPFVGLMLGLNAFANDILLPAFFGIAADLATPIETVQSLVPIFLIAAGCGQLVCGPLSDRFGRRPLLAIGFSLFMLGTLVCASADAIGTLQLGRMIQGFGSACLVVTGRAALRDTQSGPELARAMALTAAFFAVGPIIAPMSGVWLMSLGSWRTVFAGIVVAVVGLAIAGALGFRETHPTPDLRALEFGRLRAAVARIFSNTQSRRFLLTAAVLQFSIVSIISNSPRLFKSQFDIEGATYAAMFAVSAVGIIIGQIINHRLIGLHGVLHATRMAAGLLAAVAATILFATAMRLQSWPLFLAQLTVFNMGFLVVMSNSASLVLEPHRDIAGLTASVFGFLTQLTGGVLALATYRVFGGQMLVWATGLLLTTLVVYGSLVYYRPDDIERYNT